MINWLSWFIMSVAAGSMAIIFISTKNTIQLDGIISNGEWKDAKEYDLSGGGKLMMKKESNELYIAMVSGKKGWAHVYLAHGDTVKVLHASAALGEARYVRQNDLWRAVQSFKWELRDKVYNDDLVKKQQDHYRQYGWVANNNNTGNGTTFEYKIDLLRTDNNPAPFACLIAAADGQAISLQHFPTTLADNTVLQKLVQGYTSDSLRFNTASWEKIK